MVQVVATFVLWGVAVRGDGQWATLTHRLSVQHLRPGLYSGIKGGYDTFWKVPSYGNP